MKGKSTGEKFIEKTKYSNLPYSDQMQGLPQPPLEKRYPDDSEKILLPKLETIEEYSTLSVFSAIERRRSRRRYSVKELSLLELSLLLWATQGVKEFYEETATLRTVPSAGARHALETYLLINKVESINPGLYRYSALDHLLLEISLEEGVCDKITKACLGQEMAYQSAVTFVWSADVYRMSWRYSERGYRYIFLDAGHVCQNLYLAGEELNMGVCAIAAFDDDAMNEVLGIDGKNEFAIYAASVGKLL